MRKLNALAIRVNGWLYGTCVWNVRKAKALFVALALAACLASSATASAETSDDIFKVGETALRKVYADVAGIATVAAAACAAVCLFLMYFSKSGKTVDEARTWLKRIVVVWAAIITMGGIVTYMETLVPKIELK